MANLTETTTYDVGVYQLERTDPVDGGTGGSGVSNNQAKNLANRTAYLKAHVDAIESGSTVPPGIATLASPAFSGNPTAPTPPLGDNDTSIATTAFVKGVSQGILAKNVAGGANVTLTADEAGNGILIFSGALTGNINVIVPNNGRWIAENITTGAFTLTVKTAAGTGQLAVQGQSYLFYADGTNVLTAGSAAQASFTPTVFAATAGQTSFAVAYTPGNVIVTRNGSTLIGGGVDYTATSGSAVVLTSGATVGDEIVVYAFASFTVANAYTMAAADAKFAPLYQARQALVDLLHVNSQTGHRDLIRAGLLPAFFNQQWGGAPHYFEMIDSATGVPQKFEAATGYVDVNAGDATNGPVGKDTGTVWRFQAFKVSKSTTLSAIWVRVYKIGNPTANLELRILPDDGTGKPTGSTAITNGTATAQSGKLHSSDTSGQWVRFVFPTPPSLTAGTQYHVTLKSSAAVDVSNYWVWFQKNSAKAYPHGSQGTADATPTWSTAAGTANAFLAEVALADQSLLAGGIFGGGKLQFFEGAPINQSNGRCKDLKDIKGLDLTDFTFHSYWTAPTTGKPLAEWNYGSPLNANTGSGTANDTGYDRIVLDVNGSNKARITVYQTNGKQFQLVGATSVNVGDHQIGFRLRARGDGADALQLWVDGAQDATALVSQTITFDALFGQGQIGTFWLGGGFSIAVAPTQTLAMNVLPSADSPAWAFNGTATEANAFSVSGGKLYQNKDGFGSTDTGFYRKSSAALSNTNGWAIGAKVRASSVSMIGGAAFRFDVQDGTKRFVLDLGEYYFNDNPALANLYPQIDLKSTENVIFFSAKSSDAFIFVNGRLLADDTARLTPTTATNQIDAGDASASASDNADGVWDHISYYNTAIIQPQFTAGALSEYALWVGDKTGLFAQLWNGAAPVSVKQFLIHDKNSAGEDVTQVGSLRGVTSSPTSTNLSPTDMPEMQRFVVGSRIDVMGNTSQSQSATNNLSLNVAIDNININNDFVKQSGQTSDTGYGYAERYRVSLGLHKASLQWAITAGTATGTATQRTLHTEVRA